MTAQTTGTQQAEAAIEALRHELELLPDDARDEAGRLLAQHLRTLIPGIRAHNVPTQRKAA